MFNKVLVSLKCFFFFLISLFSFIVSSGVLLTADLKGFLLELIMLLQLFYLVLAVLLLYFYFVNRPNLVKIILLLFFYILLLSFVYLLIKESEVYKNFTSIDDLRKYISSFRGYASIVFILIQIVQVSFLPIPSIVVTGTGVLLFGAFWSIIYSYIGIVVGSIIAFILGKVFGYRLLLWIFGEKSVLKYLNLVETKGERLLFIALLLPFFPDDMLCMFSGVSNMKFANFIKTTFIARLFSVSMASLFISSSFDISLWWVSVLVLILLFCFLALSKNKFIKSSKYKAKISVFMFDIMVL